MSRALSELLMGRSPGERRQEVYDAVDDERDHQDAKWGTIDEHGHTIGEWILILEAELEEAKRAIIKGGGGRNSVLHEIRQVAAVAIACMEQHGTTGPEKGRAV